MKCESLYLTLNAIRIGKETFGLRPEQLLIGMSEGGGDREREGNIMLFLFMS